jgi:neutral ceramidase
MTFMPSTTMCGIRRSAASRVAAVRRLLLTSLLLLTAAAPAQAGTLRAGVGRADITPRTGYYMMGWVRSDAVLRGQHTRLFARAIVLERDGRKVALVSMDVNGISGGVVTEAARQLAGRGFSEQNILVSASHTHAAPTGWYAFTTYDTVFMTVNSPTDFDVAGTLDPQLYAFMVRQLVTAIRRADDDRGPARAGWGSSRLLGLTQNRSLEAHLADHGLLLEPGQGNAGMDPLGYAHTIDPDVEVLRVDRKLGRRYRPIGIWSTFANHGTVNKFQFDVMNADHHGSATRVTEDTLRAAGHVPAGQDVVDVYGNTDEGDQSAGLFKGGPAYADHVGRVEADHFVSAWREAGRAMSATPALDLRWTRVCFCGRTAVFGQAEFTGSEEGRGPLYDVTHQSFEGSTSPVDDPEQGMKRQVVRQSDGAVPKAVPLLAVRVADRMIVSVPGEMTAGMGERVRDAVVAASGVKHAVISGLANEYLSYFTTPEEYQRQHYEGAATLYGKLSSLVLQNSLADLAGRLARGQPAPDPYPYDPRNGATADAPPYDLGASSATATAQPETTNRLLRARFAWKGGPQGLDKPLDKPFVSIERKLRRGWTPVTDDLGLQILWRADDQGAYSAEWEVPLTAAQGSYRFVVTANHYRLSSSPFAVVPSRALTVQRVDAPAGQVAVRLAYPPARENIDLTDRPANATGGRVMFRLADGRRKTVRHVRGTTFAVRAASAEVRPDEARDRYGNANANPLGG